jgi:hypothetical protein
VATTVPVRGRALPMWTPINADGAELMAQAHAGERNTLPFTTWTMATSGFLV